MMGGIRVSKGVKSGSDSLNVKFVGNWPHKICDVFVSGDYAYVVNDNPAGLYVIDVSNPSSPYEVGAYYDTSIFFSPIRIFVDSNFAYLVTNDINGLWIIDVSDPTNPRKVFHAESGVRSDIFVQGNYAYTTDGSGGFHIYDVSNPYQPSYVGGCCYDLINGSVFVSDSYAYVVGGYERGLWVIDVSNPANPHEVGYYDTPGSAYGVYVEGSYAYVADKEAGLRVIDVSEPANPREVGYYDTPGYAWGVYVEGNYAYVADDNAGLRVIDVSDPANPREVGYYDTPGLVRVYVSGKYAYVVDDGSGLQIYKFLQYDTLAVSTGQGTPGVEIKIPVEIKTQDPIGGLQATFLIDSSKIHFQNAEMDSQLSNFSLSYNNFGDSVKVVIVSLSGDSIVPGVDTVFYLDFVIDSNAALGDSTYIGLGGVVLSDPHSQHLDVVGEGAWVYIRGVKGDLNLDGAVDVTDVVREINIILNRPPAPTQYEKWAGDMDDDGAIDVTDVVRMINVILGRGKGDGVAESSGGADIWVEGNRIMVKSDCDIAGIQFDLIGDVRGIRGLSELDGWIKGVCECDIRWIQGSYSRNRWERSELREKRDIGVRRERRDKECSDVR